MDYFHLAQDAQALHKMSNLGLAYLGDAVYEVMVRSWLCLHGKLTPSRLHKAALAYIASGQIPVRDLITRHVPLEEALDALDIVARGEAIKVTVEP